MTDKDDFFRTVTVHEIAHGLMARELGGCVDFVEIHPGFGGGHALVHYRTPIDAIWIANAGYCAEIVCLGIGDVGGQRGDEAAILKFQEEGGISDAVADAIFRMTLAWARMNRARMNRARILRLAKEISGPGKWMLD